MGCADAEHSERQLTETEICEASKQAHAQSAGFNVSFIASCDMSGSHTEGDNEFQVLRHSGYCKQDVCGSVLMGWFAVNTATGEVHDWDVGEQLLGAPISLSNDQ